MSYRRLVLNGAALIAVVVAVQFSSASAQTPKIYLDVGEADAPPGDLVTIPVFIENLPDSIKAFQMGLVLDRPDIMILRPEVDDAGTLIEAWSAGVTQVGEYDLRVTANAGLTGDPPAIPPNTDGVLFKLVCELYCDIPDTMGDRTVRIDISPVSTHFSDPLGSLIEPLDLTQGSVVAGLRCPNQGDAEPDGFVTALDLSAMVAALFEGGPNPQDPCCPTLRLDMDCDGFVTALDLSVLIDFLFAGGSEPCMP